MLNPALHETRMSFLKPVENNAHSGLITVQSTKTQHGMTNLRPLQNNSNVNMPKVRNSGFHDSS
jgi:hypothetical protein